MSILLPTRFRLFYKKFRSRSFNLLDIGAGSHSASLAKQWFPLSSYYGVDRTREYDNDENDFNAMTKFYEMDLTRLKFDDIPDNYFDVLMMAHVIEHLTNGDEVIERLLSKLNTGGVIYIEFPAARSTKFPSKKGTLNFYDDPTHCRIYSMTEVAGILATNGLKILKSGVRRDWIRVFLMPALMLNSKISLGYVAGGVFWDLLGFAEFVYAEKK